MPTIEYNSWFDEESYMDEIARMHKLSPKLDVVELLWAEFQRVQSDSTYRANLGPENRNWLLVSLSGQIVALAMELSDDLAAVCLAYLETISKKDKLFIMRVSNFEMGKGHEFFRKASSSPDYTRLKQLGLILQEPPKTRRTELG